MTWALALQQFRDPPEPLYNRVPLGTVPAKRKREQERTAYRRKKTGRTLTKTQGD